jgi:hypothetical protein
VVPLFDETELLFVFGDVIVLLKLLFVFNEPDADALPLLLIDPAVWFDELVENDGEVDWVEVDEPNCVPGFGVLNWLLAAVEVVGVLCVGERLEFEEGRLWVGASEEFDEPAFVDIEEELPLVDGVADEVPEVLVWACRLKAAARSAARPQVVNFMGVFMWLIGIGRRSHCAPCALLGPT